MNYFEVSVQRDGGTETHVVTLDSDGDFVCVDCDACGLTDGYGLTAAGVQAWHDFL